MTMHGPNFDVEVTTRTTNNADLTYSSRTISVITPHGKDPVTNQDLSYGTWQLDGDIVISKVKRVEFISSSDPAFSHSIGQQILEGEVRKKSVYRSRLLHLDLGAGTSRSIPVDSMYKEAVVESSCRRV